MLYRFYLKSGLTAEAHFSDEQIVQLKKEIRANVGSPATNFVELGDWGLVRFSSIDAILLAGSDYVG